MGNPFSIPCDPCINKVSNWIDEKVGYIHNLEKNLVALETTMEELRAKRDDLSTRVTREEDRGHQRLAEIEVWLKRVATIEKKVNDLLSARDDEIQRLCLCGFCSKSLRLRSSYRYGKKVFLTLKEVETLNCRVFEKIVEKSQTLEVQERQLQQIIVGQETMLDKAWKHLKKDGVGIMGLYGMGGVGKTTLLTQINNKFSEERCGFDFVIWVVVSKELHVEKIQDEIAQKVGLGGEEWKQKEKSQKTNALYNLLRKKRFVLFLDDIWKKVDLTEIGVPSPTTQNRCKVAFTTRSQEVCARMGVEDPMEVRCLVENDAFDLFQKKVGERTLGSDPEIPGLARKVAKKCRGLPLALNVIGETMSCKWTVREWRSAIDDLTSYAAEFADMKDKILPLLKYSYDSLKGEDVKACLLYCALFPEDYEILKERLIGYWIGEGIIDGSKGIERAENKGCEIIGDLVRASLLMEVVIWDGTRGAVRMHDVVREMALWIASELGREKEAFIVHSGVGLSEIPKVKNWNTVRRMSVMENKIRNLAGRPECLQLTTLLLQKGNLESISNEFFKSMPKLVVLDLTRNKELTGLPEGISELVSLQYLNLSFTGIRHLPKGLQKLKKLIHLDLDYTTHLSSIAGISNLHSLMILNLAFSGFSWDRSIVEELETLKHLETLTVGFKSHPPLELFISSHRLTSCTRFLTTRNVKSNGISIPVTMNKLRRFIIVNSNISEIKMGSICNKRKTVSPLHNPREPCFLSLSIVSIHHCKCLRELTLLMFASNLKDLYVREADQLENIIDKEKACGVEESGIVPFPKLVSLQLWNLPKLTNIYWNPLRFPCLKVFRVIECPNLKKLPLDSQSGMHGENGLVLTYKEKSWIEGVEWEDEATKTRFLSSCQLLSSGIF